MHTDPYSVGALLPALGGGWLGAVGAGAVFGALHVGGGRNAAFAAWAGGVGLLYGGDGANNDLGLKAPPPPGFAKFDFCEKQD